MRFLRFQVDLSGVAELIMMTLTKLNIFLDGLLYFDKTINVSKIDPYMTNGLMVKGCEEVKKIGFGVSASLALFEKASDAHCDVLIVHHSFNLPSYNRYDVIFQNRIAYLLKNEMSLFGYHFLLDAHPEVGNNIQILKTIGAKPVKPYLHHGDPWGLVGQYDKEEEFPVIEKSLSLYMSKRAVSYPFGPRKVKRVVAISGMGAPRPPVMHDLIEEKIDLFITGEVHEWNRELFREAKINFIAGGHYATEKFGLKALMEKVKDHFPNVEVDWLNVINEV